MFRCRIPLLHSSGIGRNRDSSQVGCSGSSNPLEMRKLARLIGGFPFRRSFPQYKTPSSFTAITSRLVRKVVPTGPTVDVEGAVAVAKRCCGDANPRACDRLTGAGALAHPSRRSSRLGRGSGWGKRLHRSLARMTAVAPRLVERETHAPARVGCCHSIHPCGRGAQCGGSSAPGVQPAESDRCLGLNGMWHCSNPEVVLVMYFMSYLPP